MHSGILFATQHTIGVRVSTHAQILLGEYDQLLALRSRGGADGHRAASPKTRKIEQQILYLLRSVIPPADDDQVLGTARDVKILLVKKPKIAGVQPAIVDGRLG